MASYTRMTNAELTAAMTTWIELSPEEQRTLKLETEIAALTAERDELRESMQAETAARNALDAAENRTKQARANAISRMSSNDARIKPDKNIPQSLKSIAGITAPDVVPTSSVPTVPLDCAVQPNANGINLVKWNRNGNRQGTQFIVEFRVGETGAWQIAGIVTAAKFAHTGRTPGERVYYRVRAQRAGLSSANSNEAVAYA